MLISHDHITQMTNKPRGAFLASYFISTTASSIAFTSQISCMRAWKNPTALALALTLITVTETQTMIELHKHKHCITAMVLTAVI